MSVKKQRHKAKNKARLSWKLWDILFLQLLLCLLLGAGAALPQSPLPALAKELFSAEALSFPQEEQLTEAVSTFINNHLYEKPVLPSGGPVTPEALPGDVSLAPVQVDAALLTSPTTGSITSPFGSRIHPISGDRDFHKGLDIAAGEGTTIHAIADGVVTAAGWDDSYGWNVTLCHSEGFSSRYAHCSRLIAEVGDPIRRGERIALCGSTGLSTGPHVHLECQVEGKFVDPLWIL